VTAKRALLGAVMGLALVASASAPARAETWWPFGSVAQSDYDQAITALRADPGNPGLLAAFANVASRIGNYEAAIGALESILLQNPGLNRVRVELGVMYFRVGAYDVSRFHLEQALASGALSPQVAERAQSFLAVDEDRMDGTSISGAVSAGLRWDTNPTLQSDKDLLSVVDPFFGDLVMPNDNDVEDDFSGFLQGSILWREDLGNQWGETWDTTGLTYWRWQFDTEDVDIGYSKVTTGPRLAVMPGTLDNAFVRPYLLGTCTLVDQGYATSSGGGGVAVSKRFGTWLTIGADGNARYRDSRSASQDGMIYAGQAKISMALNEDILVTLGAAYDRTDAEEDFRSSDRLTGFLGLNVRYDAPFGLTDYPWEFSFHGEVSKVTYDAPDPGISTELERDETNTRFVFRNTVGLSSSWFVFAEGGLYRTSSSINNYEVDNEYVAVGATWRF
jgi:hypothetical protein